MICPHCGRYIETPDPTGSPADAAVPTRCPFCDKDFESNPADPAEPAAAPDKEGAGWFVLGLIGGPAIEGVLISVLVEKFASSSSGAVPLLVISTVVLYLVATLVAYNHGRRRLATGLLVGLVVPAMVFGACLGVLPFLFR